MTTGEDLFMVYPAIGLLFAIGVAVSGNLGDGTSLSGKGGAFVTVVWLWPVFLIVFILERISLGKKP